MAPDQFSVLRAFGQEVEGEAVVFVDGFSPRYDLDRVTGVISKIGHAQEGQSLSGRVLIIPSAKGGVAAGWAFSDMKAKGFAPKAFVFGRTNPVMVQGAIFAGLTITEGWTPNVLDHVRSGDRLRVAPDARTITVLR